MTTEFLHQPWPWYFSGAAIAAIMLLLLFFGRSFGFSSNLTTLCTLAGAGKKYPFFNTDWKKQQWNLLFLAGAVIGGWIAATFMKNTAPMALSEATIRDLTALGITFDGELNPSAIFGTPAFTTPRLLIILILGGFLTGFGARYAGGCTSGHGISGLSNLQRSSVIAVTGFFIGGLILTHFILPHIL